MSITMLKPRKTHAFSSHRIAIFFTLKKHDIFLSTFSFNLEKNYVKNNYFRAFSPWLLVRLIVICGFWGCYLWPLTLSLAASEPLICHKWDPQSIALTTQKHSFHRPKRCKENGSRWLSETSENVNFWRFLHQILS